MQTALSVQNVLEQRNNYNLAIPFVESKQMNPYYKMSVSFLSVDISEQADQIYKIGSKCVRQGDKEQWIDLYSLKGTFLQRLATEAGIQFSPDTGDVVRIDENTWKASAFGAIKLPDGTVRTSNNFKVIDLQTEEKKYRIAYEEKSVSGITDYRAAKDVSEKYSGNWIQTGKKDNKGYPIKAYVIQEEDRQKYIERSLLDAMTQLRANAPQKAVTGAMLRVIRNLTGVKGTYTKEELKRPFAIARMTFSPDYNDPIVKQMMLQQCMQSVGNLFGNISPVAQTISVTQTLDADDEVDMPAEPMTFDQEGASGNNEGSMHPQQEPAMRENAEEDRTQDFMCDKCGDVIPRRVWEYSIEHYDRPLCYKCQKIVRNEQGR